MSIVDVLAVWVMSASPDDGHHVRMPIWYRRPRVWFLFLLIMVTSGALSLAWFLKHEGLDRADKWSSVAFGFVSAFRCRRRCVALAVATEQQCERWFPGWAYGRPLMAGRGPACAVDSGAGSSPGPGPMAAEYPVAVHPTCAGGDGELGVDP